MKSTVPSGPTAKRPCATNAELVFGEEQKAAINKRIAEQGTGEGGSAPEFSITQYNTARKQLFNDLDDNEKRTYEEKAATKNKEFKSDPDKSVIFA